MAMRVGWIDIGSFLLEMALMKGYQISVSSGMIPSIVVQWLVEQMGFLASN